MSDVFSNLAAQSLNNKVGIQPLIPPVFAAAPQLLPDTSPLPFNNQPAALAETTLFSIPPANFAEEIAETSDIEQPFKENTSPEKRTTITDLVPPDAPKQAISTFSLRHLLHAQHIAHDKMEPVSPVSQSSASAHAFDEPSSEDTPAPASPQTIPLRVGISRPLPKDRHMQAQSQATTPPVAIPTVPELPPSSKRQFDQNYTEENVSRTSTNYEPLPISPKDHPAIITDDSSHFQHLSPSSDKHIAPLAIQPISPVSLPSPQTDVHSEHIVGPDDTTIRPLLDQHAITKDPMLLQASQAAASSSVAQSVISPLARYTSQEMAGAAANINDTHGREMAADSQYRGRFFAATTSEDLEDLVSIHPTTHRSTTPDTLVSLHQEVNVANEEDAVSPIRVTIGRVVVRATPAAQPTPIQKRVLRPAQSLGEYLKQRERGSR